MTVTLIDTVEALSREESAAGRFVAALARDGVGHYVANAASHVALLTYGGQRLPVTIDDGDFGRSYVASPHSAYALYAREEIDIVGIKRGTAPALARRYTSTERNLPCPPVCRAASSWA